MGAGGEALLAINSGLINTYPSSHLSLALGDTGDALSPTATSTAYIVLFGAAEPGGGSGGLAGDIYAGALRLGQNVTGGTITTRDTNEALAITTNGTGALTIGTDSTARTISIGTSNASSTLALTGGDDWSVSTTGLAVLGASANSFTFDPTSGPTYVGTARPTKKITLSPEFAGAVFVASGSATTTGTMTSDASPSAAWRNYYKWTSSQAALQDYTIPVRITLPQDFSAWATSNAIQISYYTNQTSSAENALDVLIYNDTDTPGSYVSRSVNNTSGTAKTWTTLTIDDSDIDDNVAPDWDAAGETAVIYLKVAARGNADTLVGDIVLTYLAKY